MTPDDFRALIAASGLSNREAAAALSVSDERLIRRFKSGEEEPPPEIVARLVAVAAETLAAQMLRSLELAVGGKVELATLRVSENVISLDSEVSWPVAAAMRQAILERLARSGLKIEREE